MQSVAICDELFEGVVSVEHGDGWVRPWRLPYDKLDLYPAPGDALVGRGKESSGARLRMRTDSSQLKVDFLPLSLAPVNAMHTLDVTVDGKLLETVRLMEEATTAIFEKLPSGQKVVELWLPHDSPIELCGLQVDDGAACEAVDDPRPRWITYGSSLTHCRRAHSPARTWPAIVARRKKLNLLSLGYGGNCCLEPMVGVMIRDLPADLICLKLGINCISGALSPRTFAAAVTGLVAIIREKHPDTPMALISPIGYPPHETIPNVLENTIQRMRTDIESVYSVFTDRGDKHLYYFNGLDVFSLEEIAEYTEDQCHPNGDGIEVMAENFLRTVMAGIPV